MNKNIRAPALALAAVLTVVAPPAAHAAWPMGGVLVCGASEYEINPRIVTDGYGGMIIAWEDGRSPDDGIYAQRVNGTGITLWQQDGVLVAPDVEIVGMVSDGAGGMILAWCHSSDLYAARLDGGGSVLWYSGHISGSALNAVMCEDGYGGAIIAWVDYRFGQDIYAQRLDGDGNEVWTPDGELIADPPSLGEAESPRITTDGSGGAIVAYTLVDDDDISVKAQRVYGSGATWSGSGIGLETTHYDIHEMAVAGDGAGGAVIVWERLSTVTLSRDIFAQKVNGAPIIQWGTSPVFVCGDEFDQFMPDVFPDGQGGAFIVWEDERNGAKDIYGQRLDEFGYGLWTTYGVPVCTDTSDYQQMRPKLLGRYPSFVLVAWEDDRAYKSNGSVYGQKLSDAGGRLWGESGVPAMYGNPAANGCDFMTDGSGSIFTTTARDIGGGVYDLYARVINVFGEIAAPEPVITAVADVPGDQGGAVRLVIDPSDRDTPGRPSRAGRQLRRLAAYRRSRDGDESRAVGDAGRAAFPSQWPGGSRAGEDVQERLE